MPPSSPRGRSVSRTYGASSSPRRKPRSPRSSPWPPIRRWATPISAWRTCGWGATTRPSGRSAGRRPWTRRATTSPCRSRNSTSSPAARPGRAAAAAAPATTFHHFMETTALYQASLEKLRGASGAPPGYPILTFNPVITPPAQDARTIAAAIRFSDVTGAVGLGGVPPLPDTARDVALATGDYDGDGGEDVFVAGHLVRNGLAHATETTDRAGIRLRDRAVGAAFGDYDNDGRLDLYVATASGGRLFRNTGDSTFTDVTVAAGLGGAPPATTALFVDLDHDGDLDLFLATPAGNRVYRNTLDGRFQHMSGPIGLGSAS